VRYLIPLFLCASAHGDMLLEIPGGFVWDGGSAVRTANGWVGSGWHRFPGYSPPWDPVQVREERQAAERVIVVPPAAAPEPPPPPPRERRARIRGTLRVNGESVPFVIDPV
jgi:hypothetical protein